MEKTIFRSNVKSTLAVSGLGLLAGCLVTFFSLFPAHTLWGLAWFSSSTFGFWFFSTSLIVLFSEKHYTAGINAALYVYLMFFVTGIGKMFNQIVYAKRLGMNYDYHFPQDFLLQSVGLFLYGLLPAAMCFVAGFVLWFGRKKHLLCVALRFVPALCIALETVKCIVAVFTRHEMLFMSIVDTACLAAYVWIVMKNSAFSRKTDGAD